MQQPTYPRHALTSLISLVAPLATATTIADFDDVDLPTAYGGPGGGSYYNGSDGAGGFSSRGTEFPNSFTDFGGGFIGWEGFAASSTTDTTTAGFGNQYSAFSGSAFSGSTFAVGFTTPAPTVSFGNAIEVGGFQVTNTTYAALSMLNGDGFAKKFGGASGDDPDFFRLTVEGLESGNPTGSVEFYLADYRFPDNSQDYVVDDWNFVDLSSLGTVDALRFSLDSTDNGSFGINTPAYFAMDNLTVPEPGTATLLGLTLGGLALRRKRS